MESNKISVLIADDNKEFCSILNDYLLNQRDIVVTGIAKDGKEALALIEQRARFSCFRYNYATFRWAWGIRKITFNES